MSASMYILEEILCAARAAGASDVHLTAGSPPRMRVDGELVTMDFIRLHSADTLDILLGILPESCREQFEERGEYSFSFSLPKGGRCRANAYRQKGSTALALRLVGAEAPSALELGLPEAVVELYRLKEGLVLAAGASGSGRSTTLAALIDKINTSRNVHILTLEHPVEYLHPHKMSMVNQREIGQDSRDYVSALKAALREDTDVILLGELSGCETIGEAITAAETGHSVYTSLYASGIEDAVERIVEGFQPERQPQVRRRLANVLEAVVFQKLIPAGDGRRRAVFEVLRVNEEAREILRGGRFSELRHLLQAGGESEVSA